LRIRLSEWGGSHAHCASACGCGGDGAGAAPHEGMAGRCCESERKRLQRSQGVGVDELGWELGFVWANFVGLLASWAQCSIVRFFSVNRELTGVFRFLGIRNRTGTDFFSSGSFGSGSRFFGSVPGSRFFVPSPSSDERTIRNFNSHDRPCNPPLRSPIIVHEHLRQCR
jgi:hypothetical protein